MILGKGGALAYSQARMQARYGGHLSIQEWRQLAAIKDPGHLLQRLAVSGMGDWVRGLSTLTPAHELEELLRARLRDHIHQVAGWLPADWGPALRWTGALPDLPLLRSLLAAPDDATGLRVTDSRLAGLEDLAPEQRLVRLLEGELAPLRPAAQGRQTWLEAWLEHWSRLLAPLPAAERAGAEAVRRRLEERLYTARGLGLPTDSDTRLERGLVSLFRRHANHLGGALAYLALTALQLGRMRGLLSERLLFVTPVEAA